jgi:mannose-6-phosphate isomerase-like protein (cupin superfamily)
MFTKPIENGLLLDNIAMNIQAVYDSTLPPGENIPLHYHPLMEEIYYILSGYGTMVIADDEKEVSRGEVVFIPVLSRHMIKNTGEVPLRFMTVSVRVAINKNDEAPPYIG